MTSLDSMDIISECMQGTVVPDDIKSAQSTAIYIQSSDVSRADTFPSYTNKELYDMQSKDAVISKCLEFIETKTVPRPGIVRKQRKKRCRF